MKKYSWPTFKFLPAPVRHGLACFIIVFLLMYIVIAFSSAALSPYNWSENQRLAVGLTAVISAAIVTFAGWVINVEV